MDDRVFHLARRPKAIAQAANRFGKMVLISSSRRKWNDALAMYRQRDVVEKFYDAMKNDLDLVPRALKNETLRGLVFVYFVSLVMRSLLLQRARAAKLLDRGSIEDILRELSKLRVVHIGSSSKLTEITKKQRTMLERMNVTVPVKPCY